MNWKMKSLAYVLAVATVVLASHYLETPITSSANANQGRNITLPKR
jgi:hypothetical protein